MVICDKLVRVINMLKTDRLHHGGIMTNYRCTAACRHCLYACSPGRTDGYITEATAESVAALLKTAGCRSVHIGGGEPFLDFDGLVKLVRILSNERISVEYIETNAFWASDIERSKKYLQELMCAGADAFCISVDPFHAEYVPLELPLLLAETCRSVGFGYFLWQDRFLPAMSRLDKRKIHSREEMEKLISPRYILETAKSYGLSLGGRAINIEAEYSTNKPVSEIVNNHPCRSLVSGGHFHVDMYGRYIPPGCTGIAIPLNEAVDGIPGGKYPVYEALLSSGTEGLLNYATQKGFTPNKEGYPSTCTFCFHIRHWLTENAPSPELDPEHYMEALK